MSKTEIVGSFLAYDDEIYCVITKAKPKFPLQPKTSILTEEKGEKKSCEKCNKEKAEIGEGGKVCS